MIKTENRNFLISPNLDWLLIGGGSIILLILMNVMLTGSTPDSKMSWWVYSLSFIANFPHFLASYQILYSDHKSEILKKPRFIWAAWIAPLIILGFLVWGILQSEIKIWGHLVSAMYFFVGWHYVKQIFGGITVTNAMKKFYFNKTERWALKANLFGLWAISFFRFNVGEQKYLQDGVPYYSLNLPYWTLDLANWFLIFSGMIFIGLTINKYIREGQWPSTTAIVCFASIYAWYLPLLHHPMFMHTIPFFHSIQYLMFVYVFRRNKTYSKIEKLDSVEGRSEQVFGIWGYLASAAILGGFFMYMFPRYLDKIGTFDPGIFGPTAAYFAFTIFINIHHYFIDNVIWRGDNEQMRQYLFAHPK